MDGRRPGGERIVVRALRPASGGETVAHHEGRTVFLAGAVPGEVVVAAVYRASRRVLRARVLEVKESSPQRVPDRREALGVPGAGGIEFAHVGLAHSRVLKEQAACDQLRRIGGVDTEATGFRVLSAPAEAVGAGCAGAPPAACDLSAGTRWRTRTQLAIDPDGRPGMYAPGSHEIVPLGRDLVPLAVDEISALGLARERFPGLSRIEIAHGDDSGAIVLRGRAAAEQAPRLVEMSADWPGAWSVHAEEQSASGSVAARNRGGSTGKALRLVSGSGQVTQRVPGVARELRVSGPGFWQVHRDAAGVLTSAVRSALDGVPLGQTAADAAVLDLYCGAGLFATALAEDGHRVVGVEGSAQAIDEARVNAAGLDAAFHVSRIERLAGLPAARAAVLDPPRAGAGAAVVRALVDSSVERIVYVSCDPATFARDAAGLRSGGFELVSVTGYDLFPLTGHLELVSVLRRA